MPLINFYKRALAWAKKYNKTLNDSDQRYYRAVLIVHDDGSLLHFNNAFTIFLDFAVTISKLPAEERLRNEPRSTQFYCTFTQHHGFHVHDAKEAAVYQYSELEVPEAKDV